MKLRLQQLFNQNLRTAFPHVAKWKENIKIWQKSFKRWIQMNPLQNIFAWFIIAILQNELINKDVMQIKTSMGIN